LLKGASEHPFRAIAVVRAAIAEFAEFDRICIFLAAVSWSGSRTLAGSGADTDRCERGEAFFSRGLSTVQTFANQNPSSISRSTFLPF